VRNNERYLASFPTVSQAFLEVSDLRFNFYLMTFSILGYSSDVASCLMVHATNA
jgi:hypothetical protein